MSSMSSVTASPTVVRTYRPNRKADRVFFSGMSLLLLATVLFGFAKTYFMAGMVAAPLPNKLIHVHGAAFTLWIVLLIVQTGLIAARRVKLHMTLGLAGFGLAVAMVVLGITAAIDSMRRGTAPPGVDAQTFFVVPMMGILFFAVTAFLAYRWRRNPEAHKRLILIATINLTGAAVGRWPIAALHVHPILQSVVLWGYLVLLMGYDRISLGRFSKTTMWAGAVFVVMTLTEFPLGMSPAWHAMTRRLL